MTPQNQLRASPSSVNVLALSWGGTGEATDPPEALVLVNHEVGEVHWGV
jgi:hypothetical protein